MLYAMTELYRWSFTLICPNNVMSVNVEYLCLTAYANSFKRHICHVKNLRLGHDLPSSVNRVISRGFYFEKFHETKTLAKISEFTVSISGVGSYAPNLKKK